MCGVWRRRWMFVKETYVGYLHPDTGEIGCIILMDQGFKVLTGKSQTGLSHGLIISNLSRQIVVKDWTKRKAQEWVDCIQNTANSTGTKFESLCRIAAKHFLPPAPRWVRLYADNTMIG